jgi:hypothetical protein
MAVKYTAPWTPVKFVKEKCRFKRKKNIIDEVRTIP